MMYAKIWYHSGNIKPNVQQQFNIRFVHDMGLCVPEFGWIDDNSGAFYNLKFF